MGPVIHILHLEDDPVDVQLAVDLLREDGLNPETQRVHTLAAFERALPDHDLNLILSDYTVPGTDVLDALSLAHEKRPDIPFLFVSGTIGEELAAECLKRGATDYVLKTHMSRLPSAVRRALQEAGERARQKLSEAELARTTARFNGVISSAMDAIISTDAQQRVVLFNPAAEKMFGVPASRALGQSINQFIPSRFRPTHAQEMERFGQTGLSSRSLGHLGSVSGLRANGEEFPIEASISQVEIQGEKLYTVILRDITERQRAEETLRQTRDELARVNEELERKVQERTTQLREANTHLQTFAYTAAHDLQAPLRAIRNFSQIVLDDYGRQLGDDPRSLLERVAEAANQMKRLLDDLLDYSKVSAEDLRMEPVSLKAAVADALRLLEEDIRAKCATVSVTDPFPPVIGHSATLVLLIQNFLSNALKFIHPGQAPRIRIWAEKIPVGANVPKTAVVAEAPGHASPNAVVRLWVEDNGIGMPPGDLGKIFGVFQRLHSKQEYPGTGLGLAISRKGAERMGGRVGVESQPDKGSRFWVELRLADVAGPQPSL